MADLLIVNKTKMYIGSRQDEVYLCEKFSLVNEMYFAITLDRTTAGVVPIDVFQGITDDDASKVVDGLSPQVADKKASMEQVKKLYKLFCDCGCTMLEEFHQKLCVVIVASSFDVIWSSYTGPKHLLVSYLIELISLYHQKKCMEEIAQTHFLKELEIVRLLLQRMPNNFL